MREIDFGTIMTLVKGKKPRQLFKEAQEGALPYVDIKAFELNEVQNYTDGVKCVPCDENDVLIVCDGSRSGLVGKGIKGYVGSTLAKVSAEGIIRDYLYYFLQSKYRVFNTHKKGTGTPHLNQELLKSQKIIVLPIQQQQKIVSRIEELFSKLDKGVETLQTTKQQLAVYRQAVLKETFSNVLGKKTLIKDVCNTIKVGIVIKPTQYYVQTGGVFAFRNSNVRRGCIEDKDWVMISKSGHHANSRSEVHAGDVLISRSGVNLGMAAVVPERFDGYNAIDVIIAVPEQTKLLPEYLVHYTNSPYGQEIVKERERGAAQAHLNVKVYGNLSISIPTMEVQKEVVTKIEKQLFLCDNIEQTVDEALAQADAMRQSILKRAFEGKL